MAEQIIKSRVSFKNNNQSEFIKNTIERINKPIAHIAKLCNIDRRTLYDWRRGKYQMDYDALKILVKYSKMDFPKVSVLPRYWYVKKGAKIGAINRNKLYGNPGTIEGRRKGGLITIANFRNNPAYAKKAGFKLRKETGYPKKSDLLAEFIGIMLGDGNININQAKVSLNSKTDKEYARFVVKTIVELFRIEPSIRYCEKNTTEILIYSRNIVDFLVKCGLKIGNKVTNQVDAPLWVYDSINFIKGCLRGLIDTDGSIYFHTHRTKGIKYVNIGLCFTNHSIPLLNAVEHMLSILNIHSKNDKKRHVSMG